MIFVPKATITIAMKPHSSSGGAWGWVGVIWLIDRLIRAIAAALQIPLSDPVIAAATTLSHDALSRNAIKFIGKIWGLRVMARASPYISVILQPISRAGANYPAYEYSQLGELTAGAHRLRSPK